MYLAICRLARKVNIPGGPSSSLSLLLRSPDQYWYRELGFGAKYREQTTTRSQENQPTNQYCHTPLTNVDQATPRPGHYRRCVDNEGWQLWRSSEGVRWLADGRVPRWRGRGVAGMLVGYLMTWKFTDWTEGVRGIGKSTWRIFTTGKLGYNKLNLTFCWRLSLFVPCNNNKFCRA